MKCDSCKKEIQWLEMIGTEFICHRCITKNKLMGLILRTHMDSFSRLIKKLKVSNYEDLLKITREQIEAVVDLKQIGINLSINNIKAGSEQC